MTALVGILNLTPDSFSDGGQAGDAKNAAAQLLQLFKDGAAMVDVGAESTRPGAMPLNPDEEWKRLAPILDYIRDHNPEHLPRLSIDTRHPETAERALQYKVGWINDVGGFNSPEMVAAVKDSICDIVVMHSLTIPADPKVTLPKAADPVETIKAWALQRIKALGEQGIAAPRIIIDPGIGFGKTAQQSQILIDRTHELKLPEVRLLVGHSRKSFLSLYTDAAPKDRDEQTARISVQLAKADVDYLRVHNVRANREALGEQYA